MYHSLSELNDYLAPDPYPAFAMHALTRQRGYHIVPEKQGRHYSNRPSPHIQNRALNHTRSLALSARTVLSSTIDDIRFSKAHSHYTHHIANTPQESLSAKRAA